MQQFKQGLSGVTIVKEKGIWKGDALSQRGQGTQHDYDEAPGAKAVLMANLSSYNSDVISKVPVSVITHDNSILDTCVQEIYYSEQPAFDPTSDIEITSDSNIISYDQYLKETKNVVI
ncbi:hypothetical protein Tco_1442704 [Tanacetum coccineum]